MKDSFPDSDEDDSGLQKEGAASDILAWLTSLAGEILQTSVDPGESLVAQGLDSVTATAFLESIRSHGYEAEYVDLLNEASIHALASSLRLKQADLPTPSAGEIPANPIPLTGPQCIWAELEEQGWGSWANISVCVSMPVSLIPAAFLPAIAQSLCDANDAMRMVLLPSRTSDGVALQRVIPDFQIPVQMREAPSVERDAMRLVEAFEGAVASPYAPSTRALILFSARNDGRHWLCITMHHIFADRVGMHSLERQLRAMISKSELRIRQQGPWGLIPERQPTIGYMDYAGWQAGVAAEARRQGAETKLRRLLSGSDISRDRPVPRLANQETLDLGSFPAFSTFSLAEGQAIESLATELATIVPLLLHALFSVLVPRLTGDKQAANGEKDLLLCHVISNRESCASLQDLVGCLDTSVPVAMRLSDGETLQSLCVRTRQVFAETHRCVSALPRGGWFGETDDDSEEDQPNSFFERVPHINIIRTPGDGSNTAADAGVRTHAVQRVQKTRWGLLLRIVLPPSNRTGSGDRAPGPSGTTGIRVSAFAEHPPLATFAHYCFVELLRELLGKPRESVGELRITALADRVIDRAAFSSEQVRRVSAWVEPDMSGKAFIWDKLVERQQRWYEHDERRELLRDEHNRFVGTAANPFPFTQLDKLKEREFLESLDVPQPRLLHVLPRENLERSLVQLAPSLPGSFVIKPVGAGHSFGVSLIRDGIDLTRNGAPFNAEMIAGDLKDMAERGFCVHEDHVFRFNFSSLLIEELVIDEKGFEAPTDYKVFVLGGKILWIQLQFKEDGYNWVAFVDANFDLLPQPAWEPAICWRTHRALVCTEQAMVASRRPGCLSGIVEHSKRLGTHLKLFARLDWYADRTRGPLMGEITTFPHMLQPRSFYSAWANRLVEAEWQDPDGVAPVDSGEASREDGDLLAHTVKLLEPSEAQHASLQDFIPSQSKAPWATGVDLSYRTLDEYVGDFDLAPWGVAGGDCVALFVANGHQLGGLLLATMNRYAALPINVALPRGLLVTQLRESSATALVVIAGTKEAEDAHGAARRLPGLVVIELVGVNGEGLPSLPTERDTAGIFAPTRRLGPDEEVLILRTSGTTGEPKIVSFTLARLIRAGAGIAQSLQLSPADLGISMLPLHHIGGISCNLIAPLLAGAPMQFQKSFDPKIFFDAVAGKHGATWCYLVSTMWEMLLEYATAHPELRKTRPWARLRMVRSAGSDLPHPVARKLADLFGDKVTILPTYGMTEAMPIAAPPPSYRLERPGSVGPVLPTVSVEIIDPSDSENLKVVPDGTIGEVTVAGPTVIPRDDGDEHSQRNEFTPRGYYRTGDLGKLADDGSGWLYVVGRIKDAINRGGETIAPAEIETVLRRYPGWQETGNEVQLMIFARAHLQLGEDLAMAVAPLSTKVDLSQLNDWAAQHLPSSMLPRTLVLLPELPRSDHGKLLRARFARQLDAVLQPGRLGILQVYTLESQDSVPELREELSAPQSENALRDDEPGTTLESVLAIVREFVVGGTGIGPDTRFDEAGINSLAAVELSGRISRRFGRNLPTWITSDYPTPRALFSHLSPVRNAASSSVVTEEEGALISGIDSSESDQFSGRPFRVLFLHGEAADADLVELSLTATKWAGYLDDLVEFLFIDAPHPSPPKPEFHSAAVEAGYYQKSAYRSWGATVAETVEESIATVISKLDELEPVDGIGGICDGGLIAALVASRRPDLKLYLNIASSPLTRLPAEMAEAGFTITCPSIHFISSQDEMLSLPELLDIPKHCRKALLLQHDSGHSVPTLDAGLKREILTVIRGTDMGGGRDDAAKRPCSADVALSATGIGPRLPDVEVLHSRPASELGSRLEETVATIWAAGLDVGRTSIGRDDDFADIGGDSLAFLRILNQLEQTFEVDLRKSFRSGFTTIRDLARTLRALGVSETPAVEWESSPDPNGESDPDIDLEEVYSEMLRCTDWVETRLLGDSIALYATPRELGDLLALPAGTLNPGGHGVLTSLRRALSHPAAVFARCRWRRRIARIIKNGPGNSHQWSRTTVFRDAILYHSSEGDRSNKRLIVGFSGNAQRLMMPTYMMLCSLEPQHYDLLLLKDPKRDHYFNGIDSMGESIEALASFLNTYVEENAYRDGITLGTSAGGLASIYVALRNGWHGAVAFGPDDPDRHPELAEMIRDRNGENFHAAILVNYAEGNKRDRDSAAKLKELVPGAVLMPDSRFRRHNIVYSLLLRGELAGLLKKQFSALRGRD